MMKRIIYALAAMLLVIGLTACGKRHPVNKVELSNDYAMEHYTNEFPQYDSLETEVYYVSWEGGFFTSVGPTEPGYRAVVVLADEALEAVSDYEWTLVDNPQLTMELIDVPSTAQWYECSKFTKDKLKLVNVNYLYFDGKDTIVFDIQTT